MNTATNLYLRIVGIAQDYLGPTAERFIARHIETHLQKQPEELSEEDLETLIDWLRLSMALLTNDRRVVDSFVRRLQHLAQEAP